MQHKVVMTIVINLLLQKWTNPGSFLIYFRHFKHTLQFLQQIKMWKMSIQFTVQGFELMTFGT